jgi:hypothetical protein
MPLNNININFMKVPSSLDSLSNQTNSNNFQNIGNSYKESRLSSMSHIMVLKPKYKNYVIPVLPGQFLK